MPSAVAFGELVESIYAAAENPEVCIWLQNSAGLAGSRPSRVSVNQGVVSDEQVVKSEYCNQCMRLGICGMPACPLAPRGNRALPSSYHDADQADLADRVAPHVQRALRMRQIVEATEMSESAATALDSLGSGIVMIGAHGRLLRMNRAAETMLRRHDGLEQRDGRLAATVIQEDALLQTLVRGAAHTTAGAGASSGGVVRISRPSGKPSFTVTITPVTPRAAGVGFRKARVVALVTDPAWTPVPGAVLLRALFGFTAAESEVARMLMQGLDRQEIADRLSVSLNTVRAHLRKLFDKTATSSQARLVRTLLVTMRTVPDLTRTA